MTSVGPTALTTENNILCSPNDIPEDYHGLSNAANQYAHLQIRLLRVTASDQRKIKSEKTSNNFLTMKYLAFFILALGTTLMSIDGFLLNPKLKTWFLDKDNKFLTLIEILKGMKSIDALAYVGKFFLKISIGLFAIFAIGNFLQLGQAKIMHLISLSAIYSATVFLCIKTFRNPFKFVWESIIKPSKTFAMILIFPIFDIFTKSNSDSPSLTASFYELISHFMELLAKISGFTWPQITNHWLQALTAFLVLELCVLFTSVFIGIFYLFLGVIPFLTVWITLSFARFLSIASPNGPLRALILVATILLSGYLTFF